MDLRPVDVLRAGQRAKLHQLTTGRLRLGRARVLKPLGIKFESPCDRCRKESRPCERQGRISNQSCLHCARIGQRCSNVSASPATPKIPPLPAQSYMQPQLPQSMERSMTTFKIPRPQAPAKARSASKDEGEGGLRRRTDIVALNRPSAPNSVLMTTFAVSAPATGISTYLAQTCGGPTVETAQLPTPATPAPAAITFQTSQIQMSSLDAHTITQKIQTHLNALDASALDTPPHHPCHAPVRASVDALRGLLTALSKSRALQRTHRSVLLDAMRAEVRAVEVLVDAGASVPPSSGSEWLPPALAVTMRLAIDGVRDGISALLS